VSQLIHKAVEIHKVQELDQKKLWTEIDWLLRTQLQFLSICKVQSNSLNCLSRQKILHQVTRMSRYMVLNSSKISSSY